MKKAETKPEAGELRVLILEDNPADAELVEHELRRAKITFTSLIVEGKRAFSKALADFQPQVILSDFKLPRFDGQAALAVARLQAPDIPFIFVSGSIGEEKAIDLLSQGATDYIFKDNLARLGPAVKRAFAASRLKLEKKATDAELQRRVEEQRILAEAADRFVHINDLDTIYEYLSRMIREISGADYLWLSQYDESRQALQPRIISGFEPFRETLRERFDFDPARMVLYLKDMRPDDFNNFVARRLLPVGEGLHGLSNRNIPRPRSRAIEQLLGSDTIFSMGFSWENLLFGGLAVFFKKDNALKNGSTVEALVNLAAVAIKRLLAEKSLRESERMFATLVANLPGFIYRCRNDKDWTMEYISAGCREITGYAPEDFIANRKLAFNDIIHPDFKEKVWDQLQQKLPRREPFAFEYRIRTAAGAERWVWERGQGVFAADGSLQFLEGFITDVTARRLAENQLRESEMKYRSLVTQSPDGIFIIGLGGNFLSVNQTMCASLEYSEAEFLAMNIRDIIPERYLDLHRQRLAEIMKGKTQDAAAEYEVKARNGDIHCIAILSAPYYKDNELIGFQGIARDITEKKKMEIRLRESEEYYRTLVKTSPDAIIIVDAGGRVTFGSDKTLDLFGIPPGTDIVGVSIFAFVQPAEVSRVKERMAAILSGRSLPGISEYRLQRQDRRPFWGEVSSAPLHDDKGRDIGLLLVCRDISERKRSEAALSESEERYRLIADNTAETISVLDRDLRFTYISPSIFKLRGFTVEEALKQTLEESLTRDSLARIRDIFQEEMALEMSGTADPKRNRSLELQEFCKDGSTVWVENSLSFLRDSQGKPIGFLAVSKDISERKAAEEQIRASLKEKEVLLQEIHHRVKNNLQIISGLLTLQADQAADRPLAEVFRESQDRIRSIALIHEKLYRSHNLAEIAFDEYLRALTENLFISHSVASGHIVAKFEMEPLLLSIEKAIPLGLIVNELVTNALKHAFPGERTGEIRIGLHPSKKARFVGVKTESGTLYKASLCELTIADNGIGMPSDRDSEKEGKLGMKLVSMLTQQLQAELKITIGPGTEFRLVFPGSSATKNSKNTLAPEGA